MHINTWKEGAKTTQALFNNVQWEDKGQWTKTKTQQGLSEHKKTLLFCEDVWAPIVQGGCGVSLLRGVKNTLKHGPVQLALGVSTSQAVLN